MPHPIFGQSDSDISEKDDSVIRSKTKSDSKGLQYTRACPRVAEPVLDRTVEGQIDASQVRQGGHVKEKSSWMASIGWESTAVVPFLIPPIQTNH